MVTKLFANNHILFVAIIMERADFLRNTERVLDYVTRVSAHDWEAHKSVIYLRIDMPASASGLPPGGACKRAGRLSFRISDTGRTRRRIGHLQTDVGSLAREPYRTSARDRRPAAA